MDDSIVVHSRISGPWLLSKNPGQPLAGEPLRSFSGRCWYVCLVLVAIGSWQAGELGTSNKSVDWYGGRMSGTPCVDEFQPCLVIWGKGCVAHHNCPLTSKVQSHIGGHLEPTAIHETPELDYSVP